MLKVLNKNFGQASMSQYVIVFLLAIGAVIAMSTFVQRAIQGRIRDTRNYMLDNVKTYGNVTRPFRYEYEPYYMNVSTALSKTRNEQTRLLGGGATGIYRKDINAVSSSITNSYQAPPKDAI